MSNIQISPPELREIARQIAHSAQHIDSLVDNTNEQVRGAIIGELLKGHLSADIIRRYMQHTGQMEAWSKDMGTFAHFLTDIADAFEAADRQPQGAAITSGVGKAVAEKLHREQIGELAAEAEKALRRAKQIRNVVDARLAVLRPLRGTHPMIERMYRDMLQMRENLDGSIAQLEDIYVEGRLIHPDHHIDTTKYDLDEILDQGNQGTCVAHGMYNNLIMHGEDISGTDAQAYIDKLEAGGDRGRTSDNKGGFNIDVAYDIAKKHGYEPQISVEKGARLPLSDKRTLDGMSAAYYDKSSDTDIPQQALNSLIREVNNGEPVYIAGGTSFMGSNGGHAMNVVGVDLGKNGKPVSVTVSTNWGEDFKDDGYQTIPIKTFMTDWKKFGYFMMQLEKAKP